MSRRLLTIAASVFVALLAACSQPKAPEAPRPPPTASAKRSVHPAEAHTDEPEEHAPLPKHVRLSAKVIKDAGIKTAVTTSEILPATLDLTGEIAADPDRSARIAARVPGRIVEVRFKEGGHVAAEDVLAVLESPEVARARAVLQSTEARAHSARLNADRLKGLEGKSLASGQEVATAAAEAAALEADLAAARQTLTAFGRDVERVDGATARIALRAPITGFVLERNAVQGQTVEATHVIAVVGNLERAYFLARVFEKDLARVGIGATAEVRLNAYPQDFFEGTVESIGKQLDAAARTVIARVLVKDHRDLLKVGLFGTAHVTDTMGARGTRRLVVPIAAVTRIAEADTVFVQQPDGDFEVHPVTLGRSAAGRVEILSGLREGEPIVVQGVFTVKSAVLKSTFGGEE